MLLDIPRLRGVPWLEPGDHVTPDDITAAELDQGVRIGQGDILLVRVGHRLRRRERGPWDAAATRAGLHPSVLPLLAERQIAVLGSDSNNDTAPSVADGVEFPVHVLAINALGLMLLDYLSFGELVPLCEQAGRWSFLCVIAPLRLPTGTGSPVNPIALMLTSLGILHLASRRSYRSSPARRGSRRTSVSPGWGVEGRDVVTGCRAPSGVIRNRRSVLGGMPPLAGCAVIWAPEL